MNLVDKISVTLTGRKITKRLESEIIFSDIHIIAIFKPAL